MSHTQMNISINREYKDRLFIMIFGNNENNYYNESDATIEQAVERAIDECIEENVLADFLQKHKGDVMNTCLTEFDEKAFRKGFIEEGRIEGRTEEATENAINLFKNGVPYELVRASIEILSDEKLQSIYDEVMAEKETE